MRTTRTVSDETEIRRLIDVYFHAVDARDHERMRSIYTHDAEFTGLARPDGTGGHTHSGIDAVVALLDGTKSFAASCHSGSNTVIDVDGDTATADTFAVAFVLPKGEGSVRVRGLRYRDRLVRVEGGGWLIRGRVHCPLWQYDTPATALALPGAAELTMATATATATAAPADADR
ncbi:nuclear transport factor 2 family protein [Streptomyces niveus]|uniref:nuclear transport factor 2 family protein n=1 Tax=Streptomyces niveus TaxID=193462 RepID=UPI0033D94CDA